MTISSLNAVSGRTPLQLLQLQLAKNVSSAKVSSSDQSALSSALADIDASLQSTNQSANSTPAAPSKATIDDLISKEVANGKLTSEQATQLHGVFGSFAGADGASSGGSDFSISNLLSSDSMSSSSTASSATNTETSNDLSDTLKDFLKLLQNSSASGYSSAGTSSYSLTALLINVKI
jgi:hypothetical protein